jgi:DUF1365 family protein
MSVSALYTGTVVHQRTRPRAHGLRYGIFMMLLDLDELPGLGRGLRLFGADRPGLFSFYQRDHGDGSNTGLRRWVEDLLVQAGIAADGGAIRVLCMPRILGHAFNPLSVFFCYRRDGGLSALLYEVSNTFGQRHAYLIPVRGDAAPIVQDCGKDFYVSPFMDMDLRYRFRVSPPADRVGIAIDASDTEGVVLAARFTGGYRKLTDAALLGMFLRMPLLGLMVLAGIHWEALLIWCKGVALRPLPPAPAKPVTIVG